MRKHSQRTYVIACHVLAAALSGQALGQSTKLSDDVKPLEVKPAQTETTQSAAGFNAAVPEGKTLPANVARFRLVHRLYQADFGYGSDGKRNDMGVNYQAGVNALVGEVGLSDRLSLRVMAPVFFRNQATLDQGKFKKSALFQAKYKEKVDQAAEELRKTRLCLTLDQCRSFIERGETLPFSRDILLDSGEQLTLTAGTPIRQVIEERILAAANPQLDGTLGLGDVESGLLYNFYRSEQFLLSTGLGLRLPTGKFQVPEGQRPLGGGVTDVGMRFNIDYSPVAGLWFSLQESIEGAVTKASWRRPSELNSSQYNLAQPEDGGDGQSNSRVYEKRGLTTDTLAKVNFGFAALTPVLKPFAMSASYESKRDRPVYLDGKKYKEASTLNWLAAGVSASGLAYRVPVDIEFNYAWPIDGLRLPGKDNYIARSKQARLAPSTTEASVKLYTRF